MQIVGLLVSQRRQLLLVDGTMLAPTMGLVMVPGTPHPLNLARSVDRRAVGDGSLARLIVEHPERSSPEKEPA